MAEVKLKQQQQHTQSVEPLQIKEEPEPHPIKEEPEEFPFHTVTVKTEDDEDKSSVLHPRATEENREETNGSSSDTDHSEDYSQEQAEPKRSYAMIPADSCVTDHRPFSCSDCERCFVKKSDLTRHQTFVHHICPVCSDHFTDRNSFSAHLQTHVGEGTLDKASVLFRKLVMPFSRSDSTVMDCMTFSCSDCGKRFERNDVLKRHMAVHGKGTRKKHKCSFCEKAFTRPGTLKEHMKVHTGGKSFVCSVCDKSSLKKSDLTRHQALIHHICPVCSEGFTERDSLGEHLKTHAEAGTVDQASALFREIVKPFRCSECGKSFGWESHLEGHMFVHGQRPHKCSFCEKSFKETKRLTEHLKQVHHFCPVCEACFPDDINLNKHLRIHVEEGTLDRAFMEPFSCSDCGKSFTCYSTLQSHRSIHHSKKGVSNLKLSQPKLRTHHVCGICSKSFADRKNLGDHLRTHVVEGTLEQSSALFREMFRPFSCSECEKGFVKKVDLSRHQALVHGLCPVCSKGFADKDSLSEHLRSHVEEGTLEQSSGLFTNILEPFSCTECGKRFRTKSRVESHMFVHAEVKPFKCSVCEKSFWKRNRLAEHLKQVHRFCPVCQTLFADEGNLNDHLRTHVEEGTLDQSFIEPFSCSECGRRFTSASALQTHRSVHSGKVIHKCSICEKTFARRGNLKIHMKIHTGEKPFICSVCEKGFGQAAGLGRHQRDVHHICPVCSKGFADRDNLGDHLRSHVEEGTLEQSSVLFREIVKPFRCPECGKSFRLKARLQSHMFVHREARPHKCSICEKRFRENSRLNQHLRWAHHICVVCETSFPDDSNLNGHLRTHVAEGTLDPMFIEPFSSADCGSRLKFKSNLQKRVVEHQMRPHKCTFCEKSFTKATSLTDHLKQAHVICPICDTCFPDVTKLNEHESTHVEEGTSDQSSILISEVVNPYSCSECGKSFSLKSHLQSHMSVHAEAGSYKCSVCEENFTQKRHLTQHMQFHTGDKPFACSVCEKGFVQKSDLARHQAFIHHICPVCSEGFADRDSFSEHLRTHVEDGTLDQSTVFIREIVKPFSCSECGKTFRLKSRLQSHMLVHTGERPHKCSFCEECFKEKNSLDEHLTEVHLIAPGRETSLPDRVELTEHQSSQVEEGTSDQSSVNIPGTVSYSCSECGKSFGLKAHLQNHLSVHTKERPCRCSVCQREFKQMGHLKNHMKTHTDKSSSCPVCGKVCSYKRNLRTHMKTHLGQKPFVCSFCQKGFVLKTDLDDHIATHINEQC